jgi:hypothetical protein
MSVTREQIMTALLTTLTASGNFPTYGRRNRHPETIAATNTPALILVGHGETYERQSPSLPARRTLDVDAIIYTDVGQNENAIPDSILNPLLDGLDASLMPDSPGTGRCTLGGLVYSAMIDGEIVKAPGDVTGKGLAIVPIRVIIP